MFCCGVASSFHAGFILIIPILLVGVFGIRIKSLSCLGDGKFEKLIFSDGVRLDMYFDWILLYKWLIITPWKIYSKSFEADFEFCSKNHIIFIRSMTVVSVLDTGSDEFPFFNDLMNNEWWYTFLSPIQTNKRRCWYNFTTFLYYPSNHLCWLFLTDQLRFHRNCVGNITQRFWNVFE